MKRYNLEDSNYLVAYYATLMKGKEIEPTTGIKIKWVEKEFINVNEYRVNAIGAGMGAVLQTKRSVDLVAKDLGLLSPDQVLKNRDQP